MPDAAPAITSFRGEFRDFIGFVRRPHFTPRLPGRHAGCNSWQADWLPALSLRRMLRWALFLWLVNIVFLGPIALAAAGMGGAEHRLDFTNIPWLQALIWAPIVEELVFRYGLRRLAQALWVVPAGAIALFSGPTWAAVVLVAVIVLLCWWVGTLPAGRFAGALPWRMRQAYQARFFWAFHGSCLLFAGMHLHNFALNSTPYWLMPLLVLPQWLTGMVLGWLRVRRGIGASMLLHGLFNGGPLLIVWLVLRFVPDPTSLGM